MTNYVENNRNHLLRKITLQKNVCWICGEQMEPLRKYGNGPNSPQAREPTVDHLITKSAFKNHRSFYEKNNFSLHGSYNLAGAHRQCNSKRKDDLVYSEIRMTEEQRQRLIPLFLEEVSQRNLEKPVPEFFLFQIIKECPSPFNPNYEEIKCSSEFQLKS